MNIAWSLILPLLIVLAALNAIIMICVGYVKNAPDTQSCVKTILITTLIAIFLLALLVGSAWLMYVTPARYAFLAIDRLLNGVFNRLPKGLMLVYFFVPLAVVYIIYAVLAARHERKQRLAYETATGTKTNGDPIKKPVDLPKLLEERAESVELTNAMQFRKELNSHDDTVILKGAGQFWILAHDQNALKQLQTDFKPLFKRVKPHEYPVIIGTDGKNADVYNFKQGVSKFRKELRSKQ